ncbi:MAG: OadG family protein [Pseudohongiellaceae bacterium]
MDNELIQQGIVLTLFGMGTVFVFLIVLTLVTIAMSRAVLRFAAPEAGDNVLAEPVANPATIEDPRLIAVITAAIRQYRKNRSKI